MSRATSHPAPEPWSGDWPEVDVAGETPLVDEPADYDPYATGFNDDWQIGQDRYEAHLDRMGGAA